VRTLCPGHPQMANTGCVCVQLLNSPWDATLSPDASAVYIAMAGTHQIWIHDIARGTTKAFSGNGYERNQNGRTWVPLVTWLYALGRRRVCHPGECVQHMPPSRMTISCFCGLGCAGPQTQHTRNHPASLSLLVSTLLLLSPPELIPVTGKPSWALPCAAPRWVCQCGLLGLKCLRYSHRT